MALRFVSGLLACDGSGIGSGSGFGGASRTWRIDNGPTTAKPQSVYATWEA